MIIFLLLKIIELVCSRLLELANIRTDESSTPMDWALYSDMNRRFSEVDETVSKDSTDDHDNKQMNYVNEREDMTENPQDIKHNPFVDSIISTEAKTAILDRTRSASDLTYDGSNAQENRDIVLSKSLNLSFGLSENALKGKRRCSDTSVYYNSPGRILLPPLKIPEEPTFHVCDKKQNTSKPISVGNGNVAKKTAKLKSFKDSMGNGSKPLDSGSSSQQFQLTGNSPGVSAQVFDDVLQVAKALSASACGDTGVNNRIDRLKVFKLAARRPKWLHYVWAVVKTTVERWKSLKVALKVSIVPKWPVYFHNWSAQRKRGKRGESDPLPLIHGFEMVHKRRSRFDFANSFPWQSSFLATTSVIFCHLYHVINYTWPFYKPMKSKISAFIKNMC